MTFAHQCKHILEQIPTSFHIALFSHESFSAAPISAINEERIMISWSAPAFPLSMRFD